MDDSRVYKDFLADERCDFSSEEGPWGILTMSWPWFIPPHVVPLKPLQDVPSAHWVPLHGFAISSVISLLQNSPHSRLKRQMSLVQSITHCSKRSYHPVVTASRRRLVFNSGDELKDLMGEWQEEHFERWKSG